MLQRLARRCEALSNVLVHANSCVRAQRALTAVLVLDKKRAAAAAHVPLEVTLVAVALAQERGAMHNI